MNSSPRDNARPVCLDACLEPRLAIELLSTVQTQPQESAAAKRSLGLEADVTGKPVKIAEPFSCIGHIFNIKYTDSKPNPFATLWTMPARVARACVKFPASAAIFLGDFYG